MAKEPGFEPDNVDYSSLKFPPRFFGCHAAIIAMAFLMVFLWDIYFAIVVVLCGFLDQYLFRNKLSIFNLIFRLKYLCGRLISKRRVRINKIKLMHINEGR